jgi:DNA-3-methyladenine glycosylase II
MFAMFQCGRTDILPVGDLGVRKGFQTLYKLKAMRTAPYPHRPLASLPQGAPNRALHAWWCLGHGLCMLIRLP